MKQNQQQSLLFQEDAQVKCGKTKLFPSNSTKIDECFLTEKIVLINQEARPSLTDTDIERGVKKRQQDEMRRDYIQQKCYEIVKMWECEWWSLYKTDAPVKSYLRASFPYKRPLSEELSCNKLSMGDTLVMSNVILKCLNTCATTFPTFLLYSEILLWVGMILVIWWKNMQKKKGLCLNQEECSSRALF